MECYFAKDKINDILILDNDDSKHLMKVLRHKIADKIVVIFEQQKYWAEIVEYKTIVMCKIINFIANSNSELSCKITLVMALLKEQKFDFVIQKAVELGVYQIVPIQLSRCISILNDSKAQQKIARWQNIAKAAAKQSNRNIIPLITPVVYKIQDLKLYLSALNLVADENSKDLSFQAKINNQLSSVTILIGPEGGITSTEIAQLKTISFSNISLGKLILRAETAPLFLISIINYQTSLTVKGAEYD